MTGPDTKTAVAAIKGRNFGDLPEDFKRADAMALFKSDDIDDGDVESFVDHLIGSATKKSAGALRIKQGEKGYISLSGGQLGVAFNRPVVVKASTALALLVTHRQEVLDWIEDKIGDIFADSSKYETETRVNDKGTEWTTVTLNGLVVGSDVDRAKALLTACLS